MYDSILNYFFSFITSNIEQMKKQIERKGFVKVRLDPSRLPRDGGHVSFRAFTKAGLLKGIYFAMDQVIYTSTEECFNMRTEVKDWEYEDSPTVIKALDKLVKPDFLIMIRQKLKDYKQGIEDSMRDFR